MPHQDSSGLRPLDILHCLVCLLPGERPLTKRDKREEAGMFAFELQQIGHKPDEEIANLIAAAAGDHNKALLVVRERSETDATAADCNALSIGREAEWPVVDGTLRIDHI